ncbi:hypothetical protein WICPIJ_006455 [Wickerhamomyces pijperi]|uniref:Large ribosomal subunit protein mL67 n=1 Tax=Wickerhamomyces pijperi TaxID=599730 RepID=A0A9P8TL02_WICPI|nr:hypothetical protein WICPIJ_006455 [Wickerhamomyces pijperi]
MATRFRNAKWLDTNKFGPQVFIFRNLESGQVLYSQLPSYSDYQIKQQFQRPNWQNRKPSTRRDIWKIMAVVDCKDYESAVVTYQSLVRLRAMRDLTLKNVANQFRPKNSDGNIWYSAQYRPVYTQEAVSDLSNVVDTLQTQVKIHWEDEWRKGDLSNWNMSLVQHENLDRAALHTPKELFEQLRQQARAEFQKLRDTTATAENQQQQEQQQPTTV